MRKVVVKEDGVVDGHGPEGKVSLIRPMDGEMDEHGSGCGLDVLNCFFNDAIGMVLTNAGKFLGLIEGFQMRLVFMTVKDGGIVTSISLRKNTQITTISLEFLHDYIQLQLIIILGKLEIVIHI